MSAVDPLVSYLRDCLDWCEANADAEAAAWRRLRRDGRRVITIDSRFDEDGALVQERVLDFDTGVVLCDDHGAHDREGAGPCPHERPHGSWIHLDHVFDTGEWPPMPVPSGDVPEWLAKVIDLTLPELSEHPESISYLRARVSY
jgi:hypothetical protein